MDTTAPVNKFSDLIMGSTPVLVDFSAEWCGPCKMMPPILKDLKGMTGSDAIIIKMDVDKNPAVAASYQIQSVPTLIIFKEGKVRWRQSGVLPAAQLKAALDQVK